jgi:hypothetical protein
MDPSVVETAAQFLVGTNAGALAADMAEMRAVDLPEDTVDLRRALMAFEDARVAFDRRFADGLGGAVGRLTAAVREVRGADAAPFMHVTLRVRRYLHREPARPRSRPNGGTEPPSGLRPCGTAIFARRRSGDPSACAGFRRALPG